MKTLSLIKYFWLVHQKMIICITRVYGNF